MGRLIDMRQFLKWMISILAAFLIVLAVRAFAFAVYKVPENSLLKNGDRVIVNRLARSDFKKNDLIVFGDSVNLLGRIEALPGDTIIVGKDKFLIPTVCCRKCRCKNCHEYLINIGRGKLLVPYHSISGKAYRLYNLPF
ncbi:signal peptidase I [Prevotella sp.]|jgi:signal peptidase I, bacterial type|uniref:signal peptidase I n=1 Tax=Prevotella sp. TaxID=59823 RepID=UPI003DA494AC